MMFTQIAEVMIKLLDFLFMRLGAFAFETLFELYEFHYQSQS